MYAAPASTSSSRPVVQATQAAPSPANPPTHGAIASTRPTTERAQWSRVGARASSEHPPSITVMAPSPTVKPAPTGVVVAQAGVTAVARPSAIAVHPTDELPRYRFFISVPI